MFRKIIHKCLHFIKFSFSFFRSIDPYASNKTILLVDNETDFCDLIGNALDKQGFKVIVAHTLASAITQLKTYNPSIILLDQNLPDGLGIDFIGENKSTLENKNIILISANPSTELRETAMKLGVFDFLSKPLPPSALNKVVYLAATFY